MDGLFTDELVIRVDRTVPACLRLDWAGSSTHVNPGEVLSSFFEKMLAEARAGGSFIEMHFEALRYFNSSTLATLIRLIKTAMFAKVALRIHYDPNLKWQAVSFQPIERAVQSFGTRDKPKVEFILTPSPPS